MEGNNCKILLAFIVIKIYYSQVDQLDLVIQLRFPIQFLSYLGDSIR